MKTEHLAVTLLSPCFLGDANQSGAWRTPPFKALLREWWRIAAAPAHAYEHRALRPVEGDLFGNAWLEPVGGVSRFRQSRVRLALKHWKDGQMTSLGDDPKVKHPNVNIPVGSQLYLGYGPLTFDKASKKSVLKANAALQANEAHTLSLAGPDA